MSLFAERPDFATVLCWSKSFSGTVTGTGVVLPEPDPGSGVGSGGMCEGRSGSIMSGVEEGEVSKDCGFGLSVSDESPLSVSTVRMLLSISCWDEASVPPCLILRIAVKEKNIKNMTTAKLDKRFQAA